MGEGCEMTLWTEEQEAWACTLRRRGESHAAIGEALGRSPKAVKAKLRDLGVVFKTGTNEPIEPYGLEQPRHEYVKMLKRAEAQWTRLMEGRSFANIR